MKSATNNNRILVAMSGGVDSSVAALLLQRSGYQVIGVTMDTGFGDAPARAAAACAALGLEHHLVDVRQRFQEQVIDVFAAAYAAGKTPNPCVLCNPALKFTAFDWLMQELDAAWLATGHYVRIDERAGRHLLFQGRDPVKDQSYFLYRLPQSVLSHCLFPLGGYLKSSVRAAAEKHGLIAQAQQQESFDVCFAPQGDYRQLLQELAPDSFRPGEIVSEDGEVLGQHKGLANYTVGQRRGLELPLGYPAYVLALDPVRNRLVVGKKHCLETDVAFVEKACFLPFDQLEQPIRAGVKIRYQAQAQPATLIPRDDGLVRIQFDAPVWGVAPGQSAVFYDNELLLGGGELIRPPQDRI